MTQATVDLDEATRTFYRELDAGDPDVYARRLAPDAVFAFNDVDPVRGAEAIGQFVDAWKANFASVTHELDHVIVDRSSQSSGIEITVNYELTDHTVLKVKGSSFLDFDGDRITGYRVYVDTTRLT